MATRTGTTRWGECDNCELCGTHHAGVHHHDDATKSWSSHTNCDHPKTKAARAKCRAARKAPAAKAPAPKAPKILADTEYGYDSEVEEELERLAGLNIYGDGTRPSQFGMTEAEYRKAYNRGWRFKGDLSAADEKHYTDNEAWTDGYMDQAAGRDKWHLLNCPDHNTCGE